MAAVAGIGAAGPLAALALALAACGGGEVPEPVGRAMSDTRQDAAVGSTPRIGNSPPVIAGVRLSPTRPTPGERITAQVDVSDPDGDRVELVYQWRVDGRRVGHTEPWLQLESAGRDAHIELTVLARDGRVQGEPVTESVRMGNQPPVVQAVALRPQRVSAGQDVSAEPRAEDRDGDELEFRYGWWVNGSKIERTGPVLSGGEFRRGDRIELEVTAWDGEDESEPLRSDPIEVVNADPRVTSHPGSIGEDGVFRYALQVDDADGDRIVRYRLLQGPEGMQLGALDGRVQWEPTDEQAGSHHVEVQVEDRLGGVGVHAFRVDVAFEAPGAVPAAPAD